MYYHGSLFSHKKLQINNCILIIHREYWELPVDYFTNLNSPNKTHQNNLERLCFLDFNELENRLISAATLNEKTAETTDVRKLSVSGHMLC